jgi:hypothetical protein
VVSEINWLASPFDYQNPALSITKDRLKQVPQIFLKVFPNL